jgi:WD40 repeat protein
LVKYFDQRTFISLRRLLHNLNLTQTLEYNSKDTAWQMYFDNDCTRLLLRSDDQKSQTWDIDDLGAGNVNNFDSRKYGKWMQMYSSTVAYVNSGRVIQRLFLLGQAGDNNERKLSARFVAQGTPIRNFVVAPDGKYLFVIGDAGPPNNRHAFKNLIRTDVGGSRKKVFDRDLSDIASLYTAYSPDGRYVAATFTKDTGVNVAKIYNVTKLQSTLFQTLTLDTASRLYFSPDSQKLLIFSDAGSDVGAGEFWICGDLP